MKFAFGRALSRPFFLLALGFMISGTLSANARQWFVYFGTYTSGQSQGIYTARFDDKTGQLSAPELFATTKNPTFLAVHPNRRWLFAVSEVANQGRKPGGAASVFGVHPASGMLDFMDQESSGGAGPCHLSLDRTGRCLLVANYGSGSVSAIRIDPEGMLSPGSTNQHAGSSVNLKRQAGPHAHQAVVSPDNRFALVCDLGLDKVQVYELDPKAALLTPHSPSAVAVHPGAGPRHLAFRPDGRFFYVINELDSTACAYAWNAGKGEGKHIQTISTLPANVNAADAGLTNYCAAMVAHPNGRFVYGSNRGHDSIVVFSSDRRTGKLKTVAHTSSGGKFPRFITLDPKGKWLFSLNQHSGDIVVLKVDARTGKLSAPVSKLHLDSPVCAVFVPAPGKN